jgi:hypothetical protein
VEAWRNRKRKGECARRKGDAAEGACRRRNPVLVTVKARLACKTVEKGVWRRLCHRPRRTLAVKKKTRRL